MIAEMFLLLSFSRFFSYALQWMMKKKHTLLYISTIAHSQIVLCLCKLLNANNEKSRTNEKNGRRI